jgi:hypothetical protein
MEANLLVLHVDISSSNPQRLAEDPIVRLRIIFTRENDACTLII